jgi:hypothetical protein
MLLAAAWRRLLVAGAALAALWAAVWWVAPSAPSTALQQPPVRLTARDNPVAVPVAAGALHPVVRSQMPAPGGGRFDRFDIPGQPVAAPVNGRGQVAFYATVLHARARDGIFLADAGRVQKVAASGDSLPGGGTLAGFAEEPLPSLNGAGHVAFVAQVEGGRANEGVFLAGADGLEAIALSGDVAPGVPLGVLESFDTPALDNNDELAFVATVRRGRELQDVLYFWNGRRLQRVAAEHDLLLRIGGTMAEIGDPALNDGGVIAFPAAINKGPALGGIFVAGAGPLHLAVADGDRTPGGAVITRFAERVAIDAAGGIAFGAYLAENGTQKEAVLRVGAEGLTEIAVDGAPAPGGGHYAGFGPWPTVAADGMTAFIAAVDGGPGQLAAFTGKPGAVQRVASMGERLRDGETVGRFALNAVAAAGPGSAVTFVTAAANAGEDSAVWCRGPARP